jgi:transposase InsO family protein
MDILCELPETSGGNKHILVISDYYTKWTECFAMPNMEAKTMAKLLVEEVIVRFGTPYVIHTDQGVQFESHLFQEVCRLLQIQKPRTTPYHPQSDGMVERNNRTILTMLSALSMDIKTIGMNTSLTFQWLIEPQSMKQR